MTFTLEDLSNNENSYDLMLTSLNLNPNDYTNPAEKFIILAKKAVELNKLAKDESKIVESTYFEEAVRNSNSLYNVCLYIYTKEKIPKEKLEKLRECHFNNYDEEYNVIDPVTYKTLQENYINNKGRCYNEETIKNMVNNNNNKDPVTREEFSQNILDKFKPKYHVKDGILDLSNKGLTEVPDNLPGKLFLLNLSHNQIKEIPNNLPDIIMTVDLSHNQIKKIPNNLKNHLSSGVMNLILSYNQIDEISEELSNTVMKIDLSHNPIKKIPKCIKKSPLITT